ncbi:MAG: AAA family ATPase [Chloroflexi bacterium]|nr:AAA family ATPase [Chloroflexota bacterium]
MTNDTFTNVTGNPTLVMMAGLPGSGKSALALEIGRVLGWPVIDKDTFKAALLESGLAENIAAELAYELTFAIAQDIFNDQRRSLVLDTPLTHPRTLTKANHLVQSAGGFLKVILCRCPDELRDWRMQHRARRASQPTSILSPGGNPNVKYDYLPSHTLELDTSEPLESLVPRAVHYITLNALHGVPVDANITPEQKAELEKVIAGVRQALQELLVPELRAISETVRRSNERMAERERASQAS